VKSRQTRCSGTSLRCSASKQTSVCDDPPDQSLSREWRIANPSEFREAFDGGLHYVGKSMVVWLWSGEQAGLRLGVVASKRQFHRAVDRCRAKRRLREAYRLNRFRFDGRIDVVLVARRRILALSAREVEEDLLVLAQRAGLMKAPSVDRDCIV
jgi:ribonuclease P protein component